VAVERFDAARAERRDETLIEPVGQGNVIRGLGGQDPVHAERPHDVRLSEEALEGGQGRERLVDSHVRLQTARMFGFEAAL
jgi:hypothetical protein